MRPDEQSGFPPYGAQSTVRLERSVLKRKTSEDEAFARAFGHRASSLRKERGITQVQMAERLGISQPHVSSYENGETRLHGEVIAKVAHVLQISADDLLGLAPPKSSPLRGPKKFSRLFQQIAQLPERDQRVVARLVSSLVASHSQKAKAG